MKRIICALLSGCVLLFPGACGNNGSTVKTADPTAQTSRSEPANEVTEPPLPAEATEDPSLAVFRQTMVETPQLFAAAYFSYAAAGADPFAIMQQTAPQLCEDLPFLPAIRKEAVIGTSGHLFCIVPADTCTAVTVNRRPWDPQTEAYKEPEMLYRSESGEAILILCPNTDQIPDTELLITDADGAVTVWSPFLDPMQRISGLLDANGESLILDFTAYGERSQGIDSADLAGTWDLNWTEVEGDRNKAASGTCTVSIAPADAGSFRFTYSSRDYPEENVQDRQLLVIPGALYPGCSNGQWIGKVAEESGDAVQYALTLQADGTLLVQAYWELDGAPWVSYGCYQKLD